MTAVSRRGRTHEVSEKGDALHNGLERDEVLAELWKEAAAAEGTDRADVLVRAGERLLMIGRGEEALAAVLTARELFDTAVVTSQLAACDHNAAVVLTSLGRQDEALERHRRAVQGHRDRLESAEAAVCAGHVADHLRAVGRADEALAQYAAARDDLVAADADGDAGDCSLRRADLLIELGRNEEAVVELTTARALLTGCVSCVARCAARFVDTFAGLDRLTEALAAAEEAVALWDACGIEGEQWACEIKLAEVQARLGRADEALDRLDDLRTAYRIEGDAVGVARCDRTAAVALEVKGQAEDAERFRKKSAIVLAAAGVAA